MYTFLSFHESSINVLVRSIFCQTISRKDMIQLGHTHHSEKRRDSINNTGLSRILIPFVSLESG